MKSKLFFSHEFRGNLEQDNSVKQTIADLLYLRTALVSALAHLPPTYYDKVVTSAEIEIAPYVDYHNQGAMVHLNVQKENKLRAVYALGWERKTKTYSAKRHDKAIEDIETFQKTLKFP